jgi:hypothetical protein
MQQQVGYASEAESAQGCGGLWAHFLKIINSGCERERGGVHGRRQYR